MLKLFAHTWLVLSLLIAPLPYAMADTAMLDQGQMQCDESQQHSQHQETTTQILDTQNESSECCDKCGSSCSTCIHFSVGMSQFNSVLEHPQYSSYPNRISDTIIGVISFTEFRPPRKFHA